MKLVAVVAVDVLDTIAEPHLGMIFSYVEFG